MTESWEQVKLGDVLDKIIGGGTPSKKNESYWNGNISWCSVKDMSDDKFLVSHTEDTITDVGLKNSSANLISKGTVVTATRMGLGRAFIAGCDMAINQDLKALVPNSKIDNKFLLWLIIVNRENLDNLGTGSTVKGIRLETLKGIKINLPPLPTQRKIASILSAYDDLIENNLKRIKLLEEKAQLTYEEWFVRMKFPGHETTPINKVTGLPEGWKKMSLHDVAEVNAKSLKKGFDGEIDYIDIASVSPGTIESTTRYENSYAPGRAKRIVSHGDIIWSCVRPNRKSHAVIWNPKENLIASTGFCVITPKRLPTSYLLQFVTTNDYVGYLNNRAGGAAYPAVKAIDFKESTIVVPSENLITDFDAVFKNSLEVSWNLQNQNKLLKEARDILLPRLMTGMINVDQIQLENLQPTTT